MVMMMRDDDGDDDGSARRPSVVPSPIRGQDRPGSVQSGAYLK